MPDNLSAFDSWEYDRKIRQTLPYYDDLYAQAAGLVRDVKPAPAAWLDVGCGTGRMRSAVPSDMAIGQFVFCDVSEEMIAIARQRYAGPGTAFTVCDIRALPYDGAFDVVTAMLVMHFFRGEDRAAALRKCYEALKPEGLFVSFENFAPFTETGRAIGLDRWRRFQIRQGKSPEESRAHIDRYGKAYFPVTPAENLALMRDCGFRAAEILWLSNLQIGVWGLK